ncbi:hypothetical protein [Xanthobacter sp. VNH20]|uniref:hypothetical protein n=1 Tax=Xanthobacter sp. VNH20 TaxID=3156616 RepID=UPI0032B3C1BE
MSACARILLAGASLLCLLSAPAAALDPWADTRTPGEQAAPNWPKKLPVQGTRPDPQAAPAGAAAIDAAPSPQRPALSNRIPLPLAAPSEIRRAEIAPRRDRPPLAPAVATQAAPSAPAATPMDHVSAQALVRALPGAALPLLPPPSVSSPYAPTPNLQPAANRAPFAALAAAADAIVEEASQPDRAVSGPATNPPAQPAAERAPEVAAAAATSQSAPAPAAPEPVTTAPEQPHESAVQVAQAEMTPPPPDHANAEPTAAGHGDVAHGSANQSEAQGDAQGEAAKGGAPQGQAQGPEVPSKSDGHSPAPADAASRLPAEKDTRGGDHKADAKTPASPPAKALVVAPPPAMANGISPMDAVRALQRLQDKVAAGSVEAVEGQRRMLAQIDQDFKAAAPSVWQDPRNARALVIHVLSGGNPAVLRGILAQEPLPALDERLLRGALAYVEGREEQALRLFGEIDARTLPNALGAQVAIAQAATTVRKDPTKAARLLDLARLLMPGTLVEEAALRRQILVASQSDDPNQFGRLSRQYLDRFAHSVYAGNFRQRFAAALTRMPFIDAPDGFQRLDKLLQPLDQASRREIFLLVARSAVVQGKAKTTITAAERALESAPPLSSDAERARLYKAAALAATHEGFQQAQIELAALDRDRLAPPDATLLDAALVAADLVRTAPNVADTPPGSAPKAPDSLPARAPAQTAAAQAASPGAGGSPPVIASSAAATPLSQTPQNAASETARAPVPASAAKPPQAGAPQAPATQATAQADPAPSAIEEQARGTLAKIDKLLKEAPR